MNIILFILELILTIMTLLIFYKKYKVEGMYLWIVPASIISGIICQKEIEILNLNINLGFIINSLILIASSIIVQKKGPDEVKSIILQVIYCNIIVYTFGIFSLSLKTSSINEISNLAFNNIINLNNSLYYANFISLIIAMWINAKLYHYIRQLKNKVWITNIITSIITHFIECLIFCIIAYLFDYNIVNILELFIIRYIFVTIISIIGTKVIYIINNID